MRLVYINILMLQSVLSFAQNTPNDTPLAPITGRHKVTTFISYLSIGLPILNIDYCQPFRNKDLLKLPDGMGNYFYYTRSSVGTFLTAQEGSFRLFSLYYKDRIGAEIYYGQYGTAINNTKFDDYINKNYSGYYPGAPEYGLANWYQYFGGFEYGITYKVHWHQYVFEPKLLLGYSSPGTYDVTDNYGFKEKGSNQYLLYTVDKQILASPAVNYHLVMNFGRKFTCKGTHFAGDWGVKCEYVRIPYRNMITFTQQTFSSGTSIESFVYKDILQMVDAGVYVAFSFGKRNGPKKPKSKVH